MKLDWAQTNALSYFESLVSSDRDLPLLEAAACLAHVAHEAQDVEWVLEEVDHLVRMLQRRWSSDLDTLERLRVLNRFFFEECRFAGNVNHYDDPGNSFLHQVIQTRRGIPVSLAVIWLELAQSMGLDAAGVNFPGHFLLKVNLLQPKGAKVVIDPFTGHVLAREDLLVRLSTWMPGLPLDAQSAQTDHALSQALGSAGPRDILARMLRNLEEIYWRRNDAPALQAVKARQAVLEASRSSTS